MMLSTTTAASISRRSISLYRHSTLTGSYHRHQVSQSVRWNSSKNLSEQPPPLPPPPPSPAKAKQEFLKTQDPLQHMMKLQKELDIVRERAAERLEQKLKKTVWQRLTDPLKRHSHSWINVGAVLLAYILAHNLYQTAKEKRQVQQCLEDVTKERDIYNEALRNLLMDGTLQDIATMCVQELSTDQKKPVGGVFWNKSLQRPSFGNAELTIIQGVLKKELQQRIGEHILTEEEKRIKELQKAWQESQDQIVETSPEQELIQSILTEEVSELRDGSSVKKQRRVISM